MLIISSIPIFAVDRYALRWGWATGRRILVSVAEAVALANVTVLWGHPEDAMAVGIVLYAALAAEDEAWPRSFLLLGFAVALQPLALVTVPAIVARLGWREVARLLPMLAGPVVLVVLGPLIAEPNAMWHAVFEQPNYPAFNHATPWTSLATKLSNGGVAAGPFRAVALLVAAVAGALLCRRNPSLQRVLWVITAAFTARVAFEVVIAEYYVWPVIAGAVLLAGRRGVTRLLVFGACGIALTWFQHVYLKGVWPWWLITVIPLVVAVGLLYGEIRRGDDAEKADSRKCVAAKGPKRAQTRATLRP